MLLRYAICCSFCPSWSGSLHTRTGSATVPPGIGSHRTPNRYNLRPGESMQVQVLARQVRSVAARSRWWLTLPGVSGHRRGIAELSSRSHLDEASRKHTRETVYTITDLACAEGVHRRLLKLLALGTVSTTSSITFTEDASRIRTSQGRPTWPPSATSLSGTQTTTTSPCASVKSCPVTEASRHRLDLRQNKITTASDQFWKTSTTLSGSVATLRLCRVNARGYP